jgi:hypothetical protein
MPIRRMAIAITCFVLCSVFMWYKMEAPIRYVFMAFVFGVAVGASLFAFSYGIATATSARMQRIIASEMAWRQSASKTVRPTRVATPAERPMVTLFLGNPDEVFKKSMDR